MTAIDLKVLFDLQERLDTVLHDVLSDPRVMPIPADKTAVQRVVLEWAEAHGMLAERGRVINQLDPQQRPGAFEMFERLKRSSAPEVYGYDLAATDPDPAPQGAAPATDPAAPPSGTEEGTLPPDDADAVESAGGGMDEIPAGPQASDGKPEPKAARDLNAVADRPEEDKAPKDAERTTLDVASGPGDAGPGPSKPVHANAWTEEEDQRAIDMKIAGHTAPEIAEALGRPVPGTAFRLSKKLKGRIAEARALQKDIEADGDDAPEAGKPPAEPNDESSEPAGQGGAEGAKDAPAPKPAPEKVRAPAVDKGPRLVSENASAIAWHSEMSEAEIRAYLDQLPSDPFWTPQRDFQLANALWIGDGAGRAAEALGVEKSAAIRRWKILCPVGGLSNQQKLTVLLKDRAAPAAAE